MWRSRAGPRASIEYADRVRPGLPGCSRRLRALGVRHTVLLSGDNQANAAAVAARVGIDEAHGELLPEAKVAFVHRLVKSGERVVMVGDGTNDAPALEHRDGRHRAGERRRRDHRRGGRRRHPGRRPARLADAIAISRRTVRLARQSIWVGLGLSAAAMVVAGLGTSRPTVGALLQEAIDVAVILNALRASAPEDGARPRGIMKRG